MWLRKCVSVLLWSGVQELASDSCTCEDALNCVYDTL